MTLKYVVDGEVLPAEEATINVRDRGFLYGDAAFETMRVYNGKVFAWEPHMQRLAETCRTIHLDHDHDQETLYDQVKLALEANDLDEAAIRLSVTRGIQPGVLQPDPTVDATVVVIPRPLDRGGIRGTPTWKGPARVDIPEIRKIPDEALPASAKTHNYLNGVIARASIPTMADEALLLDGEDYLTEGTTSNVFLVRGGTLLTPSLDRAVLPGITRDGVIAIAGLLDIPVTPTDIHRSELDSVDEVFLTNTTWEIRPVTAIGHRRFQSGPVTERLQRAFRTAVEVEFYE